MSQFGSRLLVFCIWPLFAFGATAASPPYIRWVTNNVSSPYVEVVGFPRINEEPAETYFKVYAEQDDLTANLNALPMLGSYALESDSLRFIPAFPLQPGVRYLAVYKEPGAKKALNSSFQLSKPVAQPSTTVAQVYPSAAILPENLLKFYIYFSAPMSRGHIYSRIHLLDEQGAEVELPFLELDEELWDPTMTRLTLFIDPGRIKREVRPLEEVGPSLTAGKRYTLVIDAKWLDAQGAPLKNSFKRTFLVGPPDREPPDPKRWQVLPPKRGSRDPVRIEFGEAMDHALAQRLISFLNPRGDALHGRSNIGEGEQNLLFYPAADWMPGEHRIQIQSTIEDLAGNNVGKPFEVDLFAGVERKITNSLTTLSFSIP